ncbi:MULTISPECIES: site-specific integrase [unclassified Mucilaginibacter]|uniref:tyrosine-type recombinase/integrase n=1 Tax=unclassified Mucilaginibacter TaxID=2617802 RepID=UPI003398A0C3
MNATILHRELKKNRTSLLLDYSLNGKRVQETLQMYITTKPKSQIEKDQNREVLQKAELVRLRFLNKVMDNRHDITDNSSNKILLLKYFQHLAVLKKKGRSALTWHSAVLILEEFLNGEQILLKRLKESHLEKLKQYMLNSYIKKNGKKLAPNTAALYFSKIKAGLNQAYQEKLISFKISDNVKSLPKKNIPRKYLTIDEILKLNSTDCSNQLLKKAFLFSALTGLRWCDIEKLTWNDIKYSSDRGNFIEFTQKKTDSEEWVPISDDAFNLLGTRPDVNGEKVIVGLSYSPHFKAIIKKWLNKANIAKEITFHGARHTYATTLVTKGADLFVISKMLGHKDIRTTQIYSHVIDKTKVDAAKLLNIFE